MDRMERRIGNEMDKLKELEMDKDGRTDLNGMETWKDWKDGRTNWNGMDKLKRIKG